MTNIRILDIHPAFGYETEDRWKVAVSQREQEIIRANRIVGLTHHRIWGEARLTANNFSKLLSYIPYIAVIVGIARIALHINTPNRMTSKVYPEKKDIITRHIYRGATEIVLGCFFLSHLLMIVDLIQTIRDRSIVKTYQQKSKNMLATPIKD